MKALALPAVLATICFVSACDVQSGMTKKSLEKYAPSPTPVRTPEVVEQIDPADIVTVDISTEGPKLTFDKTASKTTLDCKKYNRVTINGDRNEVEIKGACKQLMINGDKNEIVAVALAEIVLNGSDNNVRHSKYANGKKPFVTDNAGGNTVMKADDPPKEVDKKKR